MLECDQLYIQASRLSTAISSCLPQLSTPLYVTSAGDCYNIALKWCVLLEITHAYVIMYVVCTRAYYVCGACTQYTHVCTCTVQQRYVVIAVWSRKVLPSPASRWRGMFVFVFVYTQYYSIQQVVTEVCMTLAQHCQQGCKVTCKHSTTDAAIHYQYTLQCIPSCIVYLYNIPVNIRK